MSGKIRRAHYTRGRPTQPGPGTAGGGGIHGNAGARLRLTIGSIAPDFSAESIGGRRVSLDRLRGRPLLLKFYRFATCPICNFHVHQFIQEYHLVEAAGLTTVV